MNCFGFGCHESKEEILFDQYNVMTIFTRESEKYDDFFEAYGIAKTDKLITAWKTFSDEHYGECRQLTIGNRDIYSISEEYKKYGMYFAERREQ